MTDVVVNSFLFGFGFTIVLFFSGYCVHLIDYFIRVK
jgi:hypothetical protein